MKYLRRRQFLIAAAAALLAVPLAHAQRAGDVPRVGVVLFGGPYSAAVEGLREGLKDLALVEGRHLVLEVRDAKSDSKAAAAAAMEFEQSGARLIVGMTTSVSVAVKRATTRIPIVIVAGSDPMEAGLVEQMSHPGGRVTGVHSVVMELTAKRLQLLKELKPALRRVLTCYDPDGRVAPRAVRQAQGAARKLQITMVERHCKTVDELQQVLRSLKRGDAEAYFFVSDAMVTSQAKSVIDAANAKGWATMVYDTGLVADGALLGYGPNYRQLGRMAAPFVQKILNGARPSDLPVQAVDKLALAVNLRTAKALGITVPGSIMVRADEVIK